MKRSVLSVGAVFLGFSGVMMVQAEPRMPTDRCESLAAMSRCPPGQVLKPLSSDKGTCRYLCESAPAVTPDANVDLPMIELSGSKTDVVLRCPFMIVGRTEQLKSNRLDGYYCINTRDDDLGRTNLLGYVKPGQNAALSAVVKKKDVTGAVTEDTVTVVAGEPFSVGYDNQAVIRYSGPVEVVAGTPPRHRHHRRHRAK